MNNILNDDEVLNKYKDMSREEVLDLFGEEKSLIQEELKNGTFSYDKLKEVCSKSSSSLVDAKKWKYYLLLGLLSVKLLIFLKEILQNKWSLHH